MTVKVIDQLPQNSPKGGVDHIVQQAVETLRCLTKHDVREIRKDIASIIESSLRVWDALRKDDCKITVNCSPEVNGKPQWQSEEFELPFINGSDELPTVSAFLPKIERSFAIFPQITGEFELEDSGKKARHTMHPGIALFAHSPVFERGLQAIEDLKDSTRQFHRRYSSVSSPTRGRFTYPKTPPKSAPHSPLQSSPIEAA